MSVHRGLSPTLAAMASSQPRKEEQGEVVYLGPLDRPACMQTVIAPLSPSSSSGTNNVAPDWSLAGPTLPLRISQRTSTSNASLVRLRDFKDANILSPAAGTIEVFMAAFRILDRHLAYWGHRRQGSRTASRLFATRTQLEVLSEALNERGTLSMPTVRKAYIAPRDASVCCAIRAPHSRRDCSAEAENLRKRTPIDRINMKHAITCILDTVATLLPIAEDDMTSNLFVFKNFLTC